METIIQLTPAQQQHHARLILGIGDSYAYLAARLMELDDLATFEELDARFREAATIFAQAAVCQEFQQRLKV